MSRAARHELARLLTNVPLILGTIGIAAIAAIALFGPQLAPHDPQAQKVLIFYPDASFVAPPTPPDEYYPLGTDPLGRDQLSRLLWGARLTLTAVLLGLAGRALLGVTLGVVAGWQRGSWLDRVIGYGTNAVAGLPQLMLALLVVIALQDRGAAGFVIALALVGWPELSQFVRTEVVRIAASAHVEAARALGARGTHVVRRHVLRDLAPQLLGLLALEAGAVLLLLAELGFIGFFISGGTFYVDDSGRPILPIRDRAPEWGQMLAGARQYAFDHQYVAFVPGLVVVTAVLAFNLFAEGLRAASDPFGRFRLSPRTLGAIGRTFVAGGLIGMVAFGYVTVRSGAMSFDDGLAAARPAAERVLPGGQLIAGVVRFTSGSHAMARPEKLNYYFRDERGRLLRVGFVDADANAMEVKLHDHEDPLEFDSFGPVGQWSAPWEAALARADDLQGRAYRNASPQYVVRVVLAQDVDHSAPLYRVQYGRPVGGGRAQIEVRLDAQTASASLPPERVLEDATSRARALLGGAVHLIYMSVTWMSPRPDHPEASGLERPATYFHQLMRSDIPDSRTVGISHTAGREGFASSPVLGSFNVGPGGTRPEPTDPVPLASLDEAVRRVEDAGGRAMREQREREGLSEWRIVASTGTFRTEVGIVAVQYAIGRPGGNPSVFFTFRYDLATGTVTGP